MLPHKLDRDYTRGEKLADRVIHIAGLVLAGIGIPILFFSNLDLSNLTTIVSLALYGIGVFTMLICSTLYNADWGPEAKAFLRRFDHAGILVMIAGTYSPFTLVNIGGLWGNGLFFTVWGLAITGVVLAFALPSVLERMMVTLCLAMGWCIVIASKPLFDSVTLPVLTLMVIGGVLYSVGVIFFMMPRLRYHIAIWHGFVVVAASVHFAAVAMAMGS